VTDLLSAVTKFVRAVIKLKQTACREFLAAEFVCYSASLSRGHKARSVRRIHQLSGHDGLGLASAQAIRATNAGMPGALQIC
jgi:hypothetical protein